MSSWVALCRMRFTSEQGTGLKVPVLLAAKGPPHSCHRARRPYKVSSWVPLHETHFTLEQGTGPKSLSASHSKRAAPFHLGSRSAGRTQACAWAKTRPKAVHDWKGPGWGRSLDPGIGIGVIRDAQSC
ncbi:hypothetical protein NDU88_004737 [Pleurodeles waltl]|uniref:Uncharacterized protein n=1 Tax=Pleurodeles waltl TaxID=8319 RepID=A0AAV7W5U2_PLEWA|nr:hypothetical protein NDU88_004737 [Pleurodeles waltl]